MLLALAAGQECRPFFDLTVAYQNVQNLIRFEQYVDWLPVAPYGTEPHQNCTASAVPITRALDAAAVLVSAYVGGARYWKRLNLSVAPRLCVFESCSQMLSLREHRLRSNHRVPCGGAATMVQSAWTFAPRILVYASVLVTAATALTAVALAVPAIYSE